MNETVEKITPGRRRVRPLTSEGIAMREALTQAESAARAAHSALDAAVRSVRRARIALVGLVPAAFLLGWLL